MRWPADVPAVLHIDMDAFYASVETAYRPSLAGRPVVVGADPGHGRGVVMSCNYEARAFGLRSAMPIAQAYRLCPDAAYVPPRFERYAKASRRVMAALEGLGTAVEPLGMDEAFLDVAPLLSSRRPVKVAALVRGAVGDATGLPCSVGIARSRTVAKIASDHRKPQGATIVPPDGTAEFLAPLSVGRMPGIGPRTRAHLEAHGVATLGDLAARDAGELSVLLGSSAPHFRNEALGLGDGRIHTGHGTPRSMSGEHTLPEDTCDEAPVLEAIRGMADDVALHVRRAGLLFRTVTLKLRFADFETLTRSTTLPAYGRSADTIAAKAMRLFAPFRAAKKPFRLVGVRVSHFMKAEGQQTLVPSS